MSVGISGVCSKFSSSCQYFVDKWRNLFHALQIVRGNVRRKPRPPLLYKKPRKSKKSGERGGKSKSGTLTCFPYLQSRE